MKSKGDQERNRRGRIFLSVAVLGSALACILPIHHPTAFETPGTAAPRLSPWNSVGGCGVGGSGGGTSGIRWIGEGVSGGLVELEILPKLNAGRNFAYLTTVPRLSIRSFWFLELGISLPITLKAAEVQYQSNLDPQTILNGGRGDLSVDVMRAFGSEGQFSWQWALTFPTGQSDAKRGSDFYKNILPQSMQTGTGTYSTALSLYYNRDLENGMLLFSGNISYPFMMRFDKENEYLDSDYKAYRNASKNRQRFYYDSFIKPYGESDRGDYYPPSVGFDAIYAYHGAAGLVQSFQLSLTAPLGVRWIHSYDPALYDPHPDPDHRAWDAVLSYGLELSRDHLPLFLAVGLPIYDRKGEATEDEYDETPFAQWNAPDWENIGQEWLFAFGIKAAMF